MAIELAQAQKYAPSIFADRPYHELSDKYAFIPTVDIVQRLLREGFEISRVQENRTRLADKHGYARHMVRMRHAGLAPQVGDLVPEIVLTNSHDGSSAFQLSAGLYRLVCSNGMVCGSDQYTMRTRHTGNPDNVIDAVFKVVEELPEAIETTREWSGIQLAEPEQLALASAVIPLRWEVDQHGNAPVTPEQLIQRRRWSDNGTDLFTTFNRIQENVIKGGVRARTSNGQRRRSTAVGSVNEDIRLNKALWTLADSMAQLKRAA